jgi:hypothetical protein
MSRSTATVATHAQASHGRKTLALSTRDERNEGQFLQLGRASPQSNPITKRSLLDVKLGVHLTLAKRRLFKARDRPKRVPSADFAASVIASIILPSGSTATTLAPQRVSRTIQPSRSGSSDQSHPAAMGYRDATGGGPLAGRTLGRSSRARADCPCERPAATAVGAQGTAFIAEKFLAMASLPV